MTDIPVFYMLNPERLLPADSVDTWLGRIVKNYNEPDGHFTPQDPQPFVLSPKAETTIDDVTTLLQASSHSSIGARLGKIVTGSYSHGSGGKIDFSTSCIRSVRLQNHGKIFDALKQDPEVKRDLAEMLTPGGKPAFMIVAVLIWTDSRFTNTRALTEGSSASTRLPVGIISTAAMGVPIVGADPEVRVSKHDAVTRSVEATSRGSHIFAIQYKTVRRPARSLVTGFKAVLNDRGPRIEGPKTFRGSEKDAEETSIVEEAAVTLEMDEDYISWTDILEEDESLEIEDLNEIGFAFEAS
jgi:hypothetical protein